MQQVHLQAPVKQPLLDQYRHAYSAEVVARITSGIDSDVESVSEYNIDSDNDFGDSTILFQQTLYATYASTVISQHKLKSVILETVNVIYYTKELAIIKNVMQQRNCSTVVLQLF